MKFCCTCGNVINATVQFCIGPCVLRTESEYILWIKFLYDMISMKEYPDFKRAFFCDECKRYSVFYSHGGDLYVFKPAPVKIKPSDDYEAYHLMDEFEEEEIASVCDDPQKRNEAINSDFTLLPKTRMMNISFAEKKAYIENLDGSIETYVVEKIVKNT